LLGISLVAVYYLFVKKDRLANYVASGILMLFVFGLISLFFSSLSFNKAHFMNFFDVRIPLYQIGITIELVLFTMALQYKTNIRNKERVMEMETLRVENEKKEFETFMAIINAKDKERTRIAQEIHDDIGSGLTIIRLLSEIAKAKNKDMASTEIDKISSSASELIENMNEIIWSINSKNDNLSNLVAYLRRYVVTYFENYEDIVVKTNMPSVIPNVQISGDFRRSTFLVVKESLHNIIKHAKASQVDLFISITMQILHISITDNGIGFDQKNIKQFSNGLKNMRDRIEGLGGNFALLSSNGSKIIINLPLQTIPT
jgi:signal transduction histidine kinase